jgi:hypothetical protein
LGLIKESLDDKNLFVKYNSSLKYDELFYKKTSN